MKNLLLCLLAASLTIFLGWKTKGNEGSKTRHFFVGFSARTNTYSEVTGCVDYKCDGFPSMKQLEAAIVKTYDYNRISILSFSEYSLEERNIFWKGSDGVKPSPISIPDTTKPKYQYFIRLNVSVQEYLYMNKIKDSIIGAYKDEMGNKTLTMYYQHENYLRERSTLDSVKVK